MERYEALSVLRKDVVDKLREFCSWGGILTGPHAANYHVGRPLFISDDVLAIYADIRDQRTKEFLERSGAVIKKEKWYKSAEETTVITTARVNGAKYLLFPKPRRVDSIEPKGLVLTNLEETIKYFKGWDPTNSYAIDALNKIANGKTRITNKDLMELDPQAEMLILG